MLFYTDGETWVRIISQGVSEAQTITWMLRPGALTAKFNLGCKTLSGEI